MRIYIDDEPLAFELKETLAFSEIMAKLTAWAESQKLFIIDYRIAAKPEFAAKEDLNSDEIDVINLQLGDQTDLVESNLRELIDYTDRVGMHVANTIQAGAALGTQEAADLKTGGVFIAESVETLSKYLPAENAAQLTNAIAVFNTQNDLIEKINALAIIQNQLKLWLRHTEFSRVTKDEAAQRLVEFRARHEDLQQELEKIAAKLTQGKEQEALQILESVSQVLVDAVVLMRIAEDAKVSSGQKFVELLGQLTAAIDARDLVTAADIVDFDLRDLLKEVA
ncbi:MAG: hypothetical protein JSR44_06240 [Spirochaetes bacterium]|nr:hypothetical protein [Spirochaetota bacterium]